MITYKNACEEICEEAEEWEPEVVGEEEDLVEEVILPGVDWESVCYQVLDLFTSLMGVNFTSILHAGLLGECLLSTSSEKGLSSFFFFILVTFCDVTNHLDRAPGVKLRSRRRSNRTRSVCRLHRRSGLRKAFGFCRNLCNFAIQFFLEPELHVFDRNTHKLLHRLEGHEYGGQAVRSIKI